MSSPVLRPVQFSSEILTRVTDDTGPLQYASHSWILGRVSFNCISQRTIDSFVGLSQSCGPNWIALQQVFNPPPARFAVSLLSPLTSSQVSASKTTFTETPLFAVCSPSAPLQGPGAQSPRVSPFRLESRMRCHCHPETMEQLVFEFLSHCPMAKPERQCGRQTQNRRPLRWMPGLC